MELKITRVDSDLPMPSYATSGSCAFDLYARRQTTIPPSSAMLIPVNFIVCVPDGHVLIIASRSSTPIKKGLMLANGIGIIDRDFCGPGDELKVQVFNFTEEPVTVERGERIAQAMLLPAEQCRFLETIPQAAVSRGGFGSTG